MRVLDLDVEGDHPGPVLARADAAADALALLLDQRVAEPVDSLRLPAEQLLVEADESVAVLACDLEVNDRVCHGADSLLGFVYDP